MLPADGPLLGLVVGAEPKWHHCRVSYRTATRKVVALVHNVLIRDKFTGICSGRFKLAAARRRGRRLMMIVDCWRGHRCLMAIVSALIALARRDGLDNQHWNGPEGGGAVEY